MVSVIVPTYNESGNVGELARQIGGVLKADYELIFVDDGSSDDSLDKIIRLAKQNKKIKYLSFSRNFGHQAALRAGLAYSSGDAVVSMDADLQHPPELLPELIKKWREGYDVVNTLRKDGKDTSLSKRITSKTFYRIMNFLSGLNMDEGAADFRLLDRKVVDVINAQQEADIFLRGYIHWIGFKQIGLPYVPAERFSGKSKYTFKKMVNLALHGVTQFSVKPLRLAYILAALAFIISIVYIVYAIVVSIVGYSVPGWLSLIVLVVFLEGAQFLLLGMIGEYLGRTFMQTKYRPEYIVAATNTEKR